MKNNQIPRCYSPGITASCVTTSPERKMASEYGETMDERIKRELDLIDKLDLEVLRERYKALTGRDADDLGPKFIRRRLAYAAQAAITGCDLTDAERGILMSIASHDPSVNESARPIAKRKLESAKALYVKVYKGVKHSIRPDGRGNYIYLNDGQTYASPTTVARMITNTHCNGRVFFGMK